MAPSWETISRCWKPLKKKYMRVRREEGSTNNLGREDDELLWFRDIGKHSSGDFSFAVVQGIVVLEDYSQVDTGPQSTFVGVYAGHGGPESASFICNNLLKNLSTIEEGRMSEEVLRNAIAETENRSGSDFRLRIEEMCRDDGGEKQPCSGGGGVDPGEKSSKSSLR